MIALTIADVAWAVGGTPSDDVDSAVLVTGKCELDSRKVEPGDLFIAVGGDSHDGHDYVEAALAAGAVAAIVSSPGPGPRIVVPETVAALAALARETLARRPEIRVVALTGSSGKTSTKDILGQVLAVDGATVWPEGSFNNELGLPQTVLRIDEDTKYLVLEMGSRGLGHIRELCQIAPPDVAVVLNVGSAHVGEFGSRDNTAAAKGEIVEALDPRGLAILNADDHYVSAMAQRTQASIRWFGSGSFADVQVVDVTLDDTARPTMTLRVGEHVRRIRFALHGEHQAANAAAAVAAATAAGMPAESALAALESVRQQSRWRMDVTQTVDSTIVVNDAYNANPESMTAALRALVAMGRKKTTWAVLGEMKELGEDSILAHDEIGRLAVRLGVDRLVGVGDACRPMVLGAASEGYYGGEAHFSPDAAEAEQFLRENVKPGDVVLVKASRAAGLEKLAAQIIIDHGGEIDVPGGSE